MAEVADPPKPGTTTPPNVIPPKEPGSGSAGVTATPPVLVVDPFVKEIADSMGMVLEPEPPKPDETPAPVITLGEMAADLEARAKRIEPEKRGDGVSGGASSVPAATAPPAAPATLPAATAPAPTPRPKVVPRAAAPAPQPAPVAPQPEPGNRGADVTEEARKAEEERYIGSLSPEQQDELAVVTYAEKNGRPGLRQKYLDYYKGFDKFLDENKGVDVEGEECQKFIAEHRPTLTVSEYNRAERAMIRDEAKAEVRKELEPDIRENERKLQEIESRPRIEATLRQVEQDITSDPELVTPEVIRAIHEKGIEEASKVYRVEAPIVQAALTATAAWREVREHVRKLDINENPIDQWLVGFIAREGQNMLAQPREAQVLSDGRTFLPMANYFRLPEAERAKHWTYDDAHPEATSVVELIAANAKLEVQRELKALEQSGFKREKKTATPPMTAAPAKVLPQTESPASPPPSPPAPSGGSPRATGNVLPGASDGGGGRNPNADFMELIVPGSSEIVGIK